MALISRRFIVLLLPVFFCLFCMNAQNEVDALRYSYTETPLSIRSAGMAGTFGALGSDLSSFWTNPGGIGAYRRGGLELAFGFHDTNVSSEYDEITSENSKANFTIQNTGIVWKRSVKNSDFGTINMGVAYSKINNFHQNISIRGEDIPSSLLDVFTAQANGTAYDDVYNSFPFGAGLAWDTYLIDPLDSNANSYVAVAGKYGSDQSKLIKRKGAMAETVFGIGSSYLDILYFGASIGFQSVRFEESSTYLEKYSAEDVVDSFNFEEKLNTTGTGINIKFGVLAKVTSWLRLGAAYHSKTAIGLTDSYSSAIDSFFKDNTHYNQQSPDNSFSYSIRTPSRLMGNIAFVMGDYGVIAGDYEYINFSSIKMSSTGLDNDYDFSIENQTINTIYRGTHRVRAGLELRIASDWRVRAGAGYRQSPFVNGVNENSALYSFSLGSGYRHDALSVDLGLGYNMNTENYYLYNSQLVDPASLAINKVSLTLGMGWRFD
ncbi:MAG: outer membrane protein transport protein [Crocinitomicaceae bacterium]|nr:outer membrane protein transport protein [Crocinitomicaceae bacterium]